MSEYLYRLYCAGCTFTFLVSRQIVNVAPLPFPCPHCGTPMVEDFDPEPQEAA